MPVVSLKKDPQEKKQALLSCVILCFISALTVFVPYIIQGGGVFTVVDDFNLQQIPFNMALNNILKNGTVAGWAWNSDLGSSAISSYTLYLGSIFFWLAAPFPAAWFPYLVGWLYVLKYVVAGLTAFLFISFFTKDPRYAVLGAVLYAFSGFQSVNLEFNLFHDVVAFFPLLLLGLEKLLAEKTFPGLFIFSVFLCAVTDYFFFVQEVVFVVLYFIVAHWTWDIKTLLKQAGLCIACGILGVGMSAVILLPSVLYILKSTRASADLFYIDALVWDTRSFLYILKGMLLPAEPMNDQSCVYAAEWSSTSCYLPLVGLSFAIAYTYRHRDRLSRLLWVLVAFSFSPLLTCGFLLFTGTYQRWWFMFVLILSLAASLTAEEQDRESICHGAVVNAVVLAVFCAMLLFMRSYEEEHGLVFRRVRFLCNAAIAMSGLCYVWLCGRFVSDKNAFRKQLLAGITAMSVLTSSATLYFYRKTDPDPDSHIAAYRLGQSLELFDSQYRYLSDDNELMFTGSVNGTGSFSSTVCFGIVEFDALFGYYNNIVRMDKASVPGLPELIGARYYLSDSCPDGEYTAEYSFRGEPVYLLQRDACPIGYRADSYILTDELMSLPVESRAIALLDSMVISPEDASAVEGIIPHAAPRTADADSPVASLVAENTGRAVSGFTRTKDGFICCESSSVPGVVYFTVPYDSGWQAFIDGVPSPIIDSGGMMALAVDGGSHDIRFSYVTPGLSAGILLSACSFAIFFAMLYYFSRKKGKIASVAQSS